MNDIDKIFMRIPQEEKEKLLYCLNNRKEYITEYDTKKFIGVHVTSSHLSITFAIGHWSMGVII